VLSAVDFNDQSLLATNEIDDVWADRLLAHKLEAAERP
jgi:hypothetical protein